MPTAARTWRAVAALLLLTAANVARSQYGTPATPRGSQTPERRRRRPGRRRRKRAIPPPPLTAGSGPGAGPSTPSIDVRETYTDNAFPDSTEPKSDFVTQVTPGIRIEGRSPRLTANFNYAPNRALLFAQQRGQRRREQPLRLRQPRSGGEVLLRRGIGLHRPELHFPFAPRPADIINSTQNRLETRTASLSPYVRHEGRDLEYELRNRNIWTGSDTADSATFARSSGPDTSQARCAASAGRWNSTTPRSPTTTPWSTVPKTRRASTVAVFTSSPTRRGGFRQALAARKTTTCCSRCNGPRFTAWRVAWRPSPRTTADLEYENRFFGPYRLARFTHRTRLTAWSVSYSRNYFHLPAGGPEAAARRYDGATRRRIRRHASPTPTSAVPPSSSSSVRAARPRFSPIRSRFTPSSCTCAKWSTPPSRSSARATRSRSRRSPGRAARSPRTPSASCRTPCSSRTSSGSAVSPPTSITSSRRLTSIGAMRLAGLFRPGAAGGFPLEERLLQIAPELHGIAQDDPLHGGRDQPVRHAKIPTSGRTGIRTPCSSA